jgi:hypothetical protein
MAVKLTKEKFNWAGVYVDERTTSKLPIELHLYYDTEYDYFHFKHVDYKDHLLNENSHLDFRTCKTRKQAMDLLGVAIFEQAEKKKYLRIQLNMSGNIGIDKEQLSKHLQIMTTYRGSGYHNIGGISERQFGIEFFRVIRLGNNGNYTYAEVDELWEIPKAKKRLVFSHWDENLIEWDEQTEGFLMKMQGAVDELCRKVTEFFNTKDVSELKDRIRQTPFLLK